MTADPIQAAKERDEAHQSLTAASRSRPSVYEQPDTVANVLPMSGVLVDPKHLRLVLADMKAAKAELSRLERENRELTAQMNANAKVFAGEVQHSIEVEASLSEAIGEAKRLDDALAEVRRQIAEFESCLRVEVVGGARGYCLEGDRCGCGGDVPAIRKTCGNWALLANPSEQPEPTGGAKAAMATGPRLVNAPPSDEPIRCPDCNALIHDWAHGLSHVCGVGDPRDPPANGGEA